MKSDLLGDYKNILVSGGAGFIGGNFIRRLLKESNANIFNIDKLGYASDKTFANEKQISDIYGISDRYFFLNTDLADKQRTESAIKFVDPDWVINFAAESHVDRSINNPSPFINSNILGTFNLLESSKNHWNNLTSDRKQDFRFLQISTDEVFGTLGNEGSFKEETPYSPRSPYSASKASSDHLVNAWHETFGLPTLITNCSNNYGPFQFPEKLIPLAILKGLKKETIPLYGDGFHIRDWLYVEDHISALLIVLKNGTIGNSYCIGGNGERTNKSVLESICSLLNSFADKSFNYSDLIRKVPDRPGHDYRYSIDSTKIRNELGWDPKYSFEDGILETVKWYLSNSEWSKRMLLESKYNFERMGNLS